MTERDVQDGYHPHPCIPLFSDSGVTESYPHVPTVIVVVLGIL